MKTKSWGYIRENLGNAEHRELGPRPTRKVWVSKGVSSLQDFFASFRLLTISFLSRQKFYYRCYLSFPLNFQIPKRSKLKNLAEMSRSRK